MRRAGGLRQLRQQEAVQSVRLTSRIEYSTAERAVPRLSRAGVPTSSELDGVGLGVAAHGWNRAAAGIVECLLASPTLRAAGRLVALTGVSVAISVAGVAVIQDATGQEEAWDTGAFWPFVLVSGFLLGAVFARSGRARSAFFVGAVFAACIVAAEFWLSRDDEGANFGPLAVVFVGPWLALLVGSAAWLGGFAVAHFTDASSKE
jgi:hypothetical protein